MKPVNVFYKNRLLLLLALLTAFPPLATDMYLPAIPLLQKVWQQPLSNSISSLIVFRVFQAAGAASPFLIFIYFMLGALSMWLISLDWQDKIHTIGLLGAASGGVILGLWLLRPPTAAENRTGL